MPSKALKATWSFFSFAILATGALAIAFSIIWRATDPVKNFIISKMDLDGTPLLDAHHSKASNADYMRS